MFVHLQQCFVQSLPHSSEEKVILPITVKQLNSRLSGTQVFWLFWFLKSLKFLFLPVLYKENLKFMYAYFVSV